MKSNGFVRLHYTRIGNCILYLIDDRFVKTVSVVLIETNCGERNSKCYFCISSLKLTSTLRYSRTLGVFHVLETLIDNKLERAHIII